MNYGNPDGGRCSVRGCGATAVMAVAAKYSPRIAFTFCGRCYHGSLAGAQRTLANEYGQWRGLPAAALSGPVEALSVQRSSGVVEPGWCRAAAAGKPGVVLAPDGRIRVAMANTRGGRTCTRMCDIVALVAANPQWTPTLMLDAEPLLSAANRRRWARAWQVAEAAWAGPAGGLSQPRGGARGISKGGATG